MWGRRKGTTCLETGASVRVPPRYLWRSRKKRKKKKRAERSARERDHRAIDDSRDPEKEVPCFLLFLLVLCLLPSQLLPHGVSLSLSCPAQTKHSFFDRIEQRQEAGRCRPGPASCTDLSPGSPRSAWSSSPVQRCCTLTKEEKKRRETEQRKTRDEHAHVTSPSVMAIVRQKKIGKKAPVSRVKLCIHPSASQGPRPQFFFPSFVFFVQFIPFIPSLLHSFTPLHSSFPLSPFSLFSLFPFANADPHRLRSGMP